MSNHETLANDIRTKFTTDISTPQSITTLYDNDITDPPGNTLWMRLSIIEFDNERVTIGGTTSKFRTFGEMAVQIFSPINTGDGGSRNLADDIHTVFRSLIYNGIVFRTPSINVIGRSDSWWQINVNCPFYTDNNY